MARCGGTGRASVGMYVRLEECVGRGVWIVSTRRREVYLPLGNYPRLHKGGRPSREDQLDARELYKLMLVFSVDECLSRDRRYELVNKTPIWATTAAYTHSSVHVLPQRLTDHYCALHMLKRRPAHIRGGAGYPTRYVLCMDEQPSRTGLTAERAQR